MAAATATADTIEARRELLGRDDVGLGRSVMAVPAQTPYPGYRATNDTTLEAPRKTR